MVEEHAGDNAVCELARAFHEDGFVVLRGQDNILNQDQVALVKAAVLARYEHFLAIAKANDIDLSVAANSERIPGFYVRHGGRIDTELVNPIAKSSTFLPDARAAGKSLVADVQPIDAALLLDLEKLWVPILDAIFRCESHEFSSKYALEYVGCVVARPGDGDQNWHLDGVHRNLTKHEPADRLNVFVPLVDISPEIGGTEMKRGSQFHEDGRRGTAFPDYSELESVTHHVSAGTPLLMDYRVWHRGLANGSATVLRPLLYFKYSRRHDELADTTTKRPAGATTAEATTSTTTTKKKRIRLQTVSTS